MKLSKQLTTLTPLSKFLAMALFIILPFAAFYLGTSYQKTISKNTSLTQGPATDTANWKTYTNMNFRYSLAYPNDWYVIEPGNDGTKSVNIKNYSGSELTEEETKNMSISPNKINITIGLYDEKIEKNQSLTDFLKATNNWNSAMFGEPTSIEQIKIGGKPALKLNYGSKFYVFSDGTDVFYSYFNPEDSHQSPIFDQILTTIKFLN